MLHDSEDSGQYPTHTHTHTHMHTLHTFTSQMSTVCLLIAPVPWFSDVPFSWYKQHTLCIHTCNTHMYCRHTRIHTPEQLSTMHCTACLEPFTVGLIWPICSCCFVDLLWRWHCWLSSPFGGSGWRSTCTGSQRPGVPYLPSFLSFSVMLQVQERKLYSFYEYSRNALICLL